MSDWRGTLVPWLLYTMCVLPCKGVVTSQAMHARSTALQQLSADAGIALFTQTWILGCDFCSCSHPCFFYVFIYKECGSLSQTWRYSAYLIDSWDPGIWSFQLAPLIVGALVKKQESLFHEKIFLCIQIGISKSLPFESLSPSLLSCCRPAVLFSQTAHKHRHTNPPKS